MLFFQIFEEYQSFFDDGPQGGNLTRDLELPLSYIPTTWGEPVMSETAF